MQHYNSQVFTDIGKAAGGATISVKLAGTNTNATIYSDDGVTVKSNPFVTNNLGQLDFYAASGKYDITVTGTQITTYTLSNQILFDPFEQNVGDSPMAFVSSNQVVPLNAADQGGFWPITIGMPSTVSNAQIVPSPNHVQVFQFVLPYKFTIGKVNWSIAVGGSGTDTADFGVYDMNQNRVFNVGPITLPTVAASGTLLPIPNTVTLNAGYYWLAQTCTTITANFPTITPGNTFIVDELISTSVKKFGQAANNAVSGALPPTLGGITVVSAQNPIALYFER